jgi:hypothetical protein
MALQMAFKAINDTTRLNGLIPTLLIYSALPRIVEYDAPLPSITQHSTILKKAITKI